MELRAWPELEETLPSLSTQEKAVLERGIMRKGVRISILAMEDGRIIDGHHRWRACIKLGIDPPVTIEHCTEEEGFALGIALNFERRQMSKQQLETVQERIAKRNATKSVARQLREQGQTQQETAEAVGVAQSTVAMWESESEADATIISADNSCIAPDYRVKIGKGDYPLIYERHLGGETQTVIAADYKVTRQAIAKIIAKQHKLAEKQQAHTAKMDTQEIDAAVTLFWGDAFDILPKLEDQSVALVVTDPPYNTTAHEWDRIGTRQEFIEWTREWLVLTRPKLKDAYHLFVFCASEYAADLEHLLLEDGWPIKSRIIWEYRNLVKGRDVKDKFIVNYQMILHCGTHELNWSPEWDDGRFAVQNYATPQSNFKEGKHHPTAKPLKLIEHLIAVGSKPDDLILDMFAGSSTTGLASQNVGDRRCYVIEKEEKFVQVSENRLGIKSSKAEDLWPE